MTAPQLAFGGLLPERGARTREARADPRDQAGRKAVEQQRGAVREPRDDDLAAAARDRPLDRPCHVLGLGDDPPEVTVLEQGPLREPLRRDVSRQHRVDVDAAPEQRHAEGAREGELRVLRGDVRPGGSEGDGTGDRDDVHDVRASRLRSSSQARQQPAGDVDTTEVVDARDPLDQIEVDLVERPSRGDPGVVDEEIDGGMSVEDPCGSSGDGIAVTDVAGLRLHHQILRERTETVLAPGDEDARPAAACQPLRGRLRRSRGRSRHHRDPARRHGASVVESAGRPIPAPALRNRAGDGQAPWAKTSIVARLIATVSVIGSA